MAVILIVGIPNEYEEKFYNDAIAAGHRCLPAGDFTQAYECYKRICLEAALATENGHSSVEAVPPQVVIVTTDDIRELYNPSIGPEAANNSGPGILNYLLARPLYEQKSDSGQPPPSRFNIIGNSPNLLEAFAQACRYAQSDASVVISGATGTGKELFAKALHNMSPRKNGPFITVDCASLPESLVESLLFGYQRGAFTGANSDKDGLIKLADKGTLFLDEIGELDPGIQKKFLRVLQERRFRPVGGGREYSSDFRLVAATNRDLASMSAEGLFREDLYYRVHILQISLPSLAERWSDAPIIAQARLNNLCARHNMPRKFISEYLARFLCGYSWPGNVRELTNVVESMFAVAKDEALLTPEHLPKSIHERIVKDFGLNAEEMRHLDALERRKNKKDRRQSSTSPKVTEGEEYVFSLPSITDGPENYREARRDMLDIFEREYLKSLHRSSQANIEKACVISKLSRPRLYELYRKHNILK